MNSQALAEIKGQNTRDLLTSFPFPIEALSVSSGFLGFVIFFFCKVCFLEAFAFAQKFAAATGDLTSLSIQDLQVSILG